MSKLFPNHIINLKKGIVFSKRKKKFITNEDVGGYHCCYIKDIYGNMYFKTHQVIIAEGLQLPKHLWPLDDNGYRYIVDHITPVKNGGTDAFENLHLIPKPDNPRNTKSKENYSKAVKGEKNHFYGMHHSKNAIEKMKEAHLGKTLTNEHRKKISETLKGRPSPHRQKIYQYTLCNELVKIWDSISTAASELGYSRDSISDCCNGHRENYKGYKWEKS